MSLGWVGIAGADLAQSKTKGVSSAGSAGQTGAGKVASAGKSAGKKMTSSAKRGASKGIAS